MKSSSTVGMLFVDSKRLRGALHDFTCSVLEAMKATLCLLYRRSCAAALEQVCSRLN